MNGSYGRAATGLTNDASFAANAGAAKAGAEGEVKTAAILDGFCLKAAILHDLRVPLPGFKANIDHVVVSGKRVLIIDTKVWKPGFYWSFFGANRRGKERIAHTEKDLSYARQALITHLRGTGAVVLSLPPRKDEHAHDFQNRSDIWLEKPTITVNFEVPRERRL